MPCENRRIVQERRASEPPRSDDSGLFRELRKAPAGTLVEASYSPGFAEDLTEWVTRVMEDGRISQTILWCRSPESRRLETLWSSGGLSQEEIHHLTGLIETCSSEGHQGSIWKLGAMDDFPVATLSIPARGVFWESAECLMRFARSPMDFGDETARLAVIFNGLWDYIDQRSPRPLALHWQQLG